jgi:hypothetical protein
MSTNDTPLKCFQSGRQKNEDFKRPILNLTMALTTHRYCFLCLSLELLLQIPKNCQEIFRQKKKRN